MHIVSESSYLGQETEGQRHLDTYMPSTLLIIERVMGNHVIICFTYSLLIFFKY